MTIDRRNFIQKAVLAGSVSAIAPFVSNCSKLGRATIDYSKFDEVLKHRVLRHELFKDPVIIDTLELLRDRKNFICRVRSRDGAVGVSVGHPLISVDGYPMFMTRLHARFIGQDARDLDRLMHEAVFHNTKRHGVPLCVQMATIEFAILDMLGNIANKPAGQLLGDVLNPNISIYLGTRISALREMEPEESLELVAQDIAETDAKAVKLRAGKGGQRPYNEEYAPGRAKRLIRMAREKFGDDMTLMIDGNGSFTVDKAIELGKVLEEYNYYFYEEPIRWDWYEEQKQVEEALSIPMAGGESEFGLHAFRYLIANEVFQVLQPDIFYFGGMIRTMQVARMAELAGLEIAPHISEGGIGYAYMLHMVSVCPAAAEYHEFKLFNAPDANGTIIPVESKAEPFQSVEGVIKVPTGSGLGLTIDPDYIATHKSVDA